MSDIEPVVGVIEFTKDTEYEQMYLLLTFDEPITREDHDDLIAFVQDEWEPSGEYKASLFEDAELPKETSDDE